MNISRLEVNRQLDSVIAHPKFKATQSHIALLKYIVDQAFSGNTNLINSNSIAVIVFGRNRDKYDEKNDPIVSINAGMLKRSLSRYYQIVGKMIQFV